MSLYTALTKLGEENYKSSLVCDYTPLLKKIKVLEEIKNFPFVTGVDFQGLIQSCVSKSKLLKKRLEEKIPILESLRPTFQKALEELPKTWWNRKGSNFINSDEYQSQITDLGQLIYTRGEVYNLAWMSDYSFCIFHPEDMKNGLLRSLFNTITIPFYLMFSPLMAISYMPAVHESREITKLTFEESNESPVIRQIKNLECKIEQYTE